MNVKILLVLVGVISLAEMKKATKKARVAPQERELIDDMGVGGNAEQILDQKDSGKLTSRH